MTTHRPAIGIFGGSFDPVHVAHLAVARAAARRLHLSELRFLPAGQPWQKPGLNTPAAHRLAMLRVALAHEPDAPWQTVIDERELRRTGPSYTIDTLTELRSELGPNVALVLLIGADQLLRLDTWRQWEALFDHAHLAVATRPGFALDALPAAVRAQWDRRCVPETTLCSTPAGHTCQLDGLDYDIAATTIRARLAVARPDTDPHSALPRGAPERPAIRAGTAEDLLPQGVLAYIEANQLYRD